MLKTFLPVKRMLYSKQLRMAVSLLAVGSLLTLNACQDNLQPVTPTSSGARLAANLDFYVLTDANRIMLINTGNLNTPLKTIDVTGLASGERLLSMDFRPATGQLVAVTNQSRLYAINLNNGVATAPGAGTPFTPAIDGNAVSLDFNPTVDRIRLVTNTGQDLRLNPETGEVVAVDGVINGVPGASINAVGYTNSRSGVTTTTLYDIDPVTDRLYRQNPPNNGTLELVGPLGIDIAGVGSMDITVDGVALAALISGNTRGLYEINLTTGGAEKVGDLLPMGMSIVGMAIPTEPVAYAVTDQNALMIFNPFAPNPIMKPITGLKSGESVYGLDFRPRNGQLYALGSTSQLYTINTSSGAATAVGGPFTPAIGIGDYGFDFNPTVDRIRLIGNSGIDLRLNPETGAVVAIDGNLNGASMVASAAAYTNNFAGATTTTLYSIDNNRSQLFIQNPPNNGTLVPVGNSMLGIQFDGANGFDIGGTSNLGYALFRSNGTTRVYSVNLTTPGVSVVSSLPGNQVVRGFSLGLGF